jgi:uncharacterized membrane protein
MRSHAGFIDHPTLRLLVALPLGLLGTAVAFDTIDLATATGAFSIAAYWLITAGIACGLLATPFVFLDWLHVPAGTRARQIGAQHVARNAVVLLLFAASWLLRDGQGVVQDQAVALSLGAAIVSLVTAWFRPDLAPEPGFVAHGDATADVSSSFNFDDSTSPISGREPPMRAP